MPGAIEGACRSSAKRRQLPLSRPWRDSSVFATARRQRRGRPWRCLTRFLAALNAPEAHQLRRPGADRDARSGREARNWADTAASTAAGWWAQSRNWCGLKLSTAARPPWRLAAVRVNGPLRCERPRQGREILGAWDPDVGADQCHAGALHLRGLPVGRRRDRSGHRSPQGARRQGNRAPATPLPPRNFPKRSDVGARAGP